MPTEQQQMLSDNFDIFITSYQHHPDGHVQFSPEEQIIGDSIDISWYVKHKNSENARTFSVAYSVQNSNLVPYQHAQNAWQLREEQILEWASQIMSETLLTTLAQDFDPYQSLQTEQIAILENFVIEMKKYDYRVDGNVQEGEIIGDSIYLLWKVRHKNSEHTRGFSITYPVVDLTNTPLQNTQEAWNLVKDEILVWAAQIHSQNYTSLINENFNPFS